MQTILGDYLKRLARSYAALRTHLLTLSAADAFVGYFISLIFRLSVSDNVCFSEDRIYAEIKILDLSVLNLKNYTDTSCIVRVYVGEIRLLLKKWYRYTLPAVRPIRERLSRKGVSFP